MRKFNKAQRNYMIIGLCVILVIMAVGYAAFASQLRISGTSNIGSNFLVKITNITVSEKIGSAADKTDITTYNDTSATFGVTLVSPGDSITYDITIANQGTMDATLKLITKTDTNNSAILFETSGVYEGDELKAGQTATMKVKVTYNPSVTSQPENLESSLNLTLDYEQSDGSITPTPEVITSEDLKTLTVTTGDGLYEDVYEDGRYLYKGSNPNNYVTFNNETWRIISVESDNKLKLMKDNSTVRQSWDSTNSNNWDRPSSIKTYLNETYLSEIKTNQDKIAMHTWSIGAVEYGNSNLAEQIASENETQSQMSKVGLITLSEYLRANTNVEQCGNLSLNNTNSTTCLTTNWMYSVGLADYYFWTISPYIANSNDVFCVNSYTANAGVVGEEHSIYQYGVSPVIYLTSDILLQGTGSSSDPYTITN